MVIITRTFVVCCGLLFRSASDFGESAGKDGTDDPVDCRFCGIHLSGDDGSLLV